MKLSLHENDRPKQCPYCHGALGGDAERSCASCGTTYHAECAVEAGKCAVLGCGGVLAATPERQACGKCRDAIVYPAFKCHVCGTGYHEGCGQEAGQCARVPCPGILLGTPGWGPPGSWSGWWTSFLVLSGLLAGWVAIAILFQFSIGSQISPYFALIPGCYALLVFVNGMDVTARPPSG